MRLVRDTMAFTSPRCRKLELDLGLGLPHPRGRVDRGRGARLHAGQRLRLRRAGPGRRPGRRRRRAAALLLLQRPHRLLRGDRQVPRGAAHLGALDEATATAPPTTRSTQLRFHTQTAGRVAHRPAARGQPRAHRHRGPGRRARRHPVAAHQLHGRGAGPAQRTARRASRCAPSRSSPTRPTSRTSPTRWAASYFVEELTDEMERRAEALFAEIDRPGRAARCSRAASGASRRTGSRAASPTRPTSSSAPSTPASGSSLA